VIAGLLVGFLALKIGSLWAVARALDICRERWLFAFLLSQGGEFAFVVLRSRATRASSARSGNRSS
jgi:glutathione-regulated potassium-efflux system ancillary protein KefC